MLHSKREQAIRADNEKFNDNIAEMRLEREKCVIGAQEVSEGLMNIEKAYHDESYDVALASETGQMEKLLSTVEMNSLKACSALEEVNKELARLAFEQMESKRTEMESGGGSQIEDYMTPQDTEAIQRNVKAKMEAAATRLRDIFLKANNQYNHVLSSFSASHDQQEEGDDDERRQLALVPALQKKIKDLRRDLEAAEAKARSITVQRTADLNKAKEEKLRYEKETQKLLLKLQLSESKKRFHEQMGRDENHSTVIISPMEHEELQRVCEELKNQIVHLEEDTKNKHQTILQLTQDVASAQYTLQNSDHTKVKLQQKCDELQKKEHIAQERANEAIEQCNEKMAALEKSLEEELRESRYKIKDLENLKKDKARLLAQVSSMEEEEKKFRLQSKEFMQQLSDARERISHLEEQITDQENEYAASLEKLESKSLKKAKEEIKKSRSMEEDQFEVVKRENDSLKSSVQTLSDEMKKVIESLDRNVETDFERLELQNMKLVGLEKKVRNLKLALAKQREKERDIVDSIVQGHRAENQMLRNQLEGALSSAAAVGVSEPDFSSESTVSSEPTLQISQKQLSNQRQKLKGKASVPVDETVAVKISPRVEQSEDNAVSSEVIVNAEQYDSQKAVDMVSAAVQTDDVVIVHSNDPVESVRHNSSEEPAEKHSNTPNSGARGDNVIQCANDLEAKLNESGNIDIEAATYADESVSSKVHHEDGVVSSQVYTESESQSHSIIQHDESPTIESRPCTHSYKSHSGEHTVLNENMLEIKELPTQEGSKACQLSGGQVADIIKGVVTNRLSRSFGEGGDDTISNEMTKPLREENAENIYKSKIVDLFLDPNGLLSSAVVASAASCGNVSGIEEYVLSCLMTMERGIAAYNLAVGLDDIKRRLADKDYVIHQEESSSVTTADKCVQSEDSLSSPLEICASTSGADSEPACVDVEMTSSKGGDTHDEIDGSHADADVTGADLDDTFDADGESHDGSAIKVVGSESGVLEVEFKPQSPRPNDNDYNIRGNTEECVDIEIGRRLSKLDSNDETDARSSENDELRDKLSAAEEEISRLNAELRELRVSHESIYDQLQKYIADKDGNSDSGHTIEIEHKASESSGNTAKSGFDPSKYLAMASADSQEKPSKKRNRASILLELSRSPSIDRSQTSSSRPLHIGSPRSHKDQIQPPQTINFSADDDDISALGEDFELETASLGSTEPGEESAVVTEERKRLKDLLSVDDAESIGMIKSENFDRLRNGPFGGDDVVVLTRLEFYNKTISDENDALQQPCDVESKGSRYIPGSKLSNLSPTRKKNVTKTKILQRAAEVEILAQRSLVLKNYSIEELVKFLSATEATLLKLSTFGVWKRLQHAAQGGLFHDILVVHRDSLNRCIAAAGGYQKALLNVQIENDLESDTSFWPDFFRVKVLEYYRKELLNIQKMNTTEVADLNSTIDKLREDLKYEKECIIQERAWALKEISAMSVHLQKRLTMVRGSSVFNDMDLKDISEALPLDDDEDTEEKSPTDAQSETVDSRKPKKKVVFADPTGLGFAPRLYEQESSFYLKAKEIERSLKAKTFFKKVINSRMLLSSFRKSSSVVSDEPSGLFTPRSAAEESKSTVDQEPDPIHSSAVTPKSSSDEINIQPSKSPEPKPVPIINTSQDEAEATVEDTSNNNVFADDDVDASNNTIDDNENDNEVAEGDDYDDECSEYETEVPSSEYDPNAEPLLPSQMLKRQDSRKIEKVVINVAVLQLQLQEIALAIYKYRSESAVVLAQALTSVLFNWDKAETTVTSLTACLTLCRPDSEDVKCINSLREFAESSSSNMKLSDLMHARDTLLDAIQFYEAKTGSGHRKRTASLVSIDDTHLDTDEPRSRPRSPVDKRVGGASTQSGQILCQSCAGLITGSKSNSPLKSSSSPRRQSPRSPSGSATCSSGFSSRSRSPSPQRGRKNVIVTSSGKAPSESRKRKPSRPEKIVEVIKKTVDTDDKACQTESNEEVVVTFQPDDEPSHELTKLGSVDQSYSDPGSITGDVFLVKLVGNLWDIIDKDTQTVVEPFNNFGVEISPGVRMVSNYFLFTPEPEINPVDPDGPPLNDGQLEMKRLPLGVVLVRKRKPGTLLFKGIIEWNSWDELGVPAPTLPDDIIAVEIPPVLDLTPSVQLYSGGFMSYAVEIPPDVWFISVQRSEEKSDPKTYFGELDVLIPPGFVMVKLSESLVISADLHKRLPVGVTLAEVTPHKLVQLCGRYASLPTGVLLSPGVMVATAECSPPPKKERVSFPPNAGFYEPPAIEGSSPDSEKEDQKLIPLTLPPGIIAVYIDDDAVLPSFLKPLKVEGEPVEVDVDQVDIDAESDATAFMCKANIVVLQCPSNLTLPQGALLIKRPHSINGIPRPLPPGMSLCPPSLIPKRLSLKDSVEIVCLTPIYEIPAGTKITSEATVYPRPLDMRLPHGTVLVRRLPGAHIPAGITLEPMPDIPYGAYVPNEIELWGLPHGIRLPAGAEFAEGLVVSDFTPQLAPGQDLQNGIYFITRDPSLKGTDLPAGMERALKQHLPSGCLLPPGVEAVRIRPRYEIPAGVQIQAGAMLGNDMQLPPGSEVLPNIEVVQWPQGMFLPPNIELVRRIDRSVGLPCDIVVVQENADEFKAIEFSKVNNTPPRGCFFIRLPHKVNIPTSLELADRCMVVELSNPDSSSDYSNDRMLKELNLPENVVAIKRVQPSVASKQFVSAMANTPLPPEFTPYPSSLLPKNVHLPLGVELVSVHPHFELPAGAIIKGGLIVRTRVCAFTIPSELTVMERISIDTPASLPEGVELYPNSDSSGGLSGYLITRINDNVVSWGEGFEEMDPVTPQQSMPHLPEGYFLINTTKLGNGTATLPEALEIVTENLPTLTHYQSLPRGLAIVRLKSRIYLPYGIRISSVAAIPPKIQLCPGDIVGTPHTEVGFGSVGSCFDPSKLSVLTSDDPGISIPDRAVTLKQDEQDLTNSDIPPLHCRLKNWFKQQRLSTIGVSCRGHGNMIQGVIPAPSSQYADLAELILSRSPSRCHSRTYRSRPTSKTGSKSGDVDEVKSAILPNEYENDLLIASEQIEKLNDKLDDAEKENRIARKTIDMGIKDLDMAKARCERLEKIRDEMTEELNTVQAELSAMKQREKKDDAAARIRITDLTQQNRVLQFTVNEQEDVIKDLKVRVSHMKATGMTRADSQKLEKQHAENISVAREDALNEYRKLLKISVRTAFHLVKAVVSAAEKDRHSLTFSVKRAGQDYDPLSGYFNPNSDEISQLTIDDDDMSLNSSIVDMESTDTSADRESFAHSKPVSTESFKVSPALVSLSNSLPTDYSKSSKSQPNFRVGTAKLSSGGGMSTGRLVGKKRLIKPLIKKNQLPVASVDETPLYALATSIVDSIYDSSSMGSNNSGTRSRKGNHSKPAVSVSATSRSIASAGSGPFITASSKGLVANKSVNIAGGEPRSSTITIDREKEFPQGSILSLELLEPEVRIPVAGISDNTDKKFKFDDINPEKFISDLEGTYHLVRQEGKSSGSHYVVDSATADSIASEWLKNAVAITISAISTTLGNYVSAFHLIESEVDCHIAERKRLHKKLKHIEGMYNDVVSNGDVPLEKRMQFRLDELNKSLCQLYVHSENMRRMSHETVLEVIKAKSAEVEDLSEQERRLRLSSMVVKKKAMAEEVRLKRSDFDENDRIALTHYIDSLRKRGTILLERAETVRSQCACVSASIKKELEAFEGAVQNVMPPNIITKVLQWGIVHSQRAVRDPHVQNGTGAVGAAPRAETAVSTDGKQPTLSLVKSSPSLADQMLPVMPAEEVRRNQTSRHRNQNKLPSLKPDPFNRYFTSSSEIGQKKSDKK